MSDLPNRVRAAFASEQRELEPIADAPRRLMAFGLAGRRRSHVLAQGAAAAAIVLTVAAVVGILMLTRTPRAFVPANAPPTAVPTWQRSTPSAVATPSTPAFDAPETTSALVFHDAVNPTQLDAVTWDGTGAGRLDGLQSGLVAVANPTGSRFITSRGIVDRHGKAASPLAIAGKQLPIWADDGRTVCRITPEVGTPAGMPAYLETADINGSWRRAGQYGVLHDQSGVTVAACSVLNDRAVIVEQGGQGLTAKQLWVVQLSTGHVIWSRSSQLDGDRMLEVTASRDGSYVAEGATTCCPRAPSKTTVFGSGGSVVGSFDGRAGGFSWDGSRVVLASGADEGSVTVVDVRSGRAVWTGPTGLKVAGTAAEPTAGGRLALILNGSGAFAGSDGFVPPGDLYLVDVSGAGHQVTGLRARP